MAQQAFEKLGAFYLGREHDLKSGRTSDETVLYDAKDLTTHAFCVGMTGSGKTGLCIGLLEEAAIDGIPALIIDPKGDLGNLMLTFPNLSAADFRPWVNEEDARRKNMDVDGYAAGQAELWRKGLASWGQDGDRIRRLKEAADFAIYTPGSEAGIPVSILASFAAPPAAVAQDGDLLRDRVGTTATSLLGLLGIDADPIQSREHILLSTIFADAWSKGQDLDLAALIGRIQSPPVARIGVMETDSFFPPDKRFALAMQLNNLLAAPGFQAWLTGTPLDIQNLLYTPEGKPRMAIFSIAHLPESERMFFVSLLLNQLLGWMRTRPGTNSLRALLYMDEIAGYLPPVANPPTKKPMLTLLKQARAFGVGVVLATQNPVDLDYKGLSNTGTWFLGRLQTERDKARVLEGLEGAGAGSAGFDRKAMEETLAGLGKRVFLMHNVHEERPVVFETRWVMSYLRGPLTREQIKRVMADRPAESSGAADVSAGASSEAAPAPLRPVSASADVLKASRPLLSPSVPQAFLPVLLSPDAEVIYRPELVGLYRIQFVDRKTKQTVRVEEGALRVDLGETARSVDWDEATELDLVPEDLEPNPDVEGRFETVRSEAENSLSYRSWEKQLADLLYRGRSMDLFRSDALSVSSKPGESEQEFRTRLGDLGRELRDEQVAELRAKFAKRKDRLEERMRKAEQKLAKESEQASQQKLSTALSFGATLLSAVLGRKSISRGTVGRATTALRSATRGSKEAADIRRAEEDLEAIRTQVEELQRDLETEIEQLTDRLDPRNEQLETISVRPRRSDVEVRRVALVWHPVSASGASLWS